MALYNNGYRLGNTPFKRGLGALASIYNGGGSALNYAGPTGAMRASAHLFGEYNAYPTGNLHPKSWMLPQKSGAMSLRAIGDGDLSADLIPTRPMSIDLTGFGDMEAIGALAVAMGLALTGSGTLTAAIVGDVIMAIDLAGSGDLAADMEGIASLAVDMLGQGDLDATISAFGNMEIDIVVTGAGLSTANVGSAVWNAIAANFNDSGTMGNKLNTASSGGVDLNALAAAVHGYTVESGLTFEEVTRIIAAALAGTTEKAGSTITFKGLDGTTDRIVGSFDAENNRTGAVLDGS